MQQNNYSDDEIVSTFQNMNNQHYSGKLDGRDLRTIDSALSSPPNFGPRVASFSNEQQRRNSPEKMYQLINSVYPGGIKYNELTNQIELNNIKIEDKDISTVRNAARSCNIDSSKDFVVDVIVQAAHQNSYDPFKTWVESKSWDGITDHIDKLFETLKIKKEFSKYDSLIRMAFRRFIIGSIYKCYNPGKYGGFVFVLHGKQGLGKSRWFSKLVDKVSDAWSEGAVDPDNKDHKFYLADYIFFHISELDAITGKKKAHH